MVDEASEAVAFGPNAWLVDELYERYMRDPSSVAESWRDFFEGYGDHRLDSRAPDDPSSGDPGPSGPLSGGPGPSGADEDLPVAPVAAVTVAPRLPEVTFSPPVGPTTETADKAVPLRGAAARVAENMEASLGVPTATSVRVVPARLLEVNRKVLNGYLGRTGGGKVSVTHLVGWAVVRATESVPGMRRTFARHDRQPVVVDHHHVGLGLAVDVEKPDGRRSLVVPCIRDADTLDFRSFKAAYEELIRRVRTGRVGADDFAGVTMTLTNPGTLGTVQSVPRLMPDQAVIVGVGALEFPAEWEGADPRVLAQLGISKVLTLTSTYDHRVIQGAESGLFLKRIHELLLGADDFYRDVFVSAGVPYEPVRWRRDVNPGEGSDEERAKQVHVQTLINMYRVRGHLIADLDPLRWKEPRTHPELDPATYGLTIWDLDREFFTDGLAGTEVRPLGEVLGILRDAYCRRVGVEYMHIQEPDQKHWIQEHVEGVSTALTTEEQLHILDRLNAAEAFERFLHTKYVGHKRFGLEGAESAIPLIDEVLDNAARAGCDEAVLGMAHRGRLNVLASIVGKSLRQIFREFEGDIDPATTQGSGDVKYHVGASGKFVGRGGAELPVSLASNPSHLEAVDPVVEGMVRAKQDLIDQPEAFSVLPLVIHGDAAFAGQGVVAETLNLSLLRGYRVGGTVHLVINNQVGFTTSTQDARSSVYATDVAKMVQAPIFHVNGDDPEACVRVARLAFAFRQAFHKDVVVDMVCYRRHGHNEGDDPSYTQPLMYKRIEGRRSVRKLYTETLVRRGDIGVAEAEKALDDFVARMQTAFDETRQSTPPDPRVARTSPAPLGALPPVATAVDRGVLDQVVDTVNRPPEGFVVHPKLIHQMETRVELWSAGLADWAMAEILALGSLLLEGTDIRLSGQDSRRGTFSHRHSVLVDYQNGSEWVPLSSLSDTPFGHGAGTPFGHGAGTPFGHGAGTRGKFRVYDSMLSEYAALGFEYGYSVVHKDALVCWEAQFGDFVNASQVIVDQFIAAAETKWGQTSGLVLLLPHGHEGQGPEHSSARLERFLTLCAGDNLCVANVTTAAQYFHIVRRQVRRQLRKPLVLLTPKFLLRAHTSRSPIADFTEGWFREVIDDDIDDPSAVRRVILAAGKVAYDAMAARDKHALAVPVIRVEQLYPWPEAEVLASLGRYEHATEVVWLQEEPENMGAWPFVHERLHRQLRGGLTLRHVSRAASASPASGSQTVHQHEQEDLIERVLEGL